MCSKPHLPFSWPVGPWQPWHWQPRFWQRKVHKPRQRLISSIWLRNAAWIGYGGSRVINHKPMGHSYRIPIYIDNAYLLRVHLLGYICAGNQPSKFWEVSCMIGAKNHVVMEVLLGYWAMSTQLLHSPQTAGKPLWVFTAFLVCTLWFHDVNNLSEPYFKHSSASVNHFLALVFCLRAITFSCLYIDDSVHSPSQLSHCSNSTCSFSVPVWGHRDNK